MAGDSILRGTAAYRREFSDYLRTGRQITLLQKSAALDSDTSHYVWRTAGDGKVRGAHAANEGKVFAWSDPPPTGHPGKDHNCRCRAEPYVHGETEFAEISITSDLSGAGKRWENWNFVVHYFSGEGKPVNLRDIGHLREIAEYHAYDAGAYKRIRGQIAELVRKNGPGRFNCIIVNKYQFESVEFAHGKGIVRGIASVFAKRHYNMLSVHCSINFTFYDLFKDPLDTFNWIETDIEIFGKPYAILGEWQILLLALIKTTKNDSNYRFEFQENKEPRRI